MGGLISAKFLVLLVIALIVLGPEKLPGAARTAGRLLSEFRRLTTGLQDEVREAFAGSDLAAPVQELRAVTSELRSSVTGLVTAPFTAPPTTSAAGEVPVDVTSGPGPEHAYKATTAEPPSSSGRPAPQPQYVGPAVTITAGLRSGDLGPPPGDPSLN